jgi:hypothetical protein
MYGREELGRLPLVNQPGSDRGFQPKPFVYRSGKAEPDPSFLPQGINETLRPLRGLRSAPHDSQARENPIGPGARIGEKLLNAEGGLEFSTSSTGPVASTPIYFLILKDRKKGRRVKDRLVWA